MGKAACPDYKGPENLAGKGELCTQEKYRRNSPGTDRRRNVTDEEKRLMNQLREEGMAAPEIARHLQRSISCVYRHLHQGGKHPRWTDEDNQILVDGYLEGLPTEKIATKLDRSPTAVRVAWWRHKKRCQEDVKKQYTMKMIVKAFGVIQDLPDDSLNVNVTTQVLKAVRKADIYREVENYDV